MSNESSANPQSPAATRSMDDIVALCRRRGFIWQSSEIYGGINGFWDYGPLGVELKRNLKEAWWHDIVRCPGKGPDGDLIDVVGVDCTIIMNPKVWEASGHVGGFNDPMQSCYQCRRLIRADHGWQLLGESPWFTSLASLADDAGLIESSAILTWINTVAPKLAPNLHVYSRKAVHDDHGSEYPSRYAVLTEWLASKSHHSVNDVINHCAQGYGPVVGTLELQYGNYDPSSGLIMACPHCGGDLSYPRQFNLMFPTVVGAVIDDPWRRDIPREIQEKLKGLFIPQSEIAYLRPETAQGIFTQFWNVVDTSRVKVPFGIAQQGKAFRNEVTPRNFTFRSREFEQMEIEFFIRPDQADEWYRYWRDARYNWWKSIGLAGDNLQLREHEKEELAHYAKEGAGVCDIEYRFPFTAPGFGELEGVAHRADYDLRAHATACGKGDKLRYFDQERNERYFPHVIEPSAGADRGTLALLCEAYTPDSNRPSGVYMKFHPRLAPIKAAIFPLVNKDGMPEIAEKLYMQLRQKWNVQIDVKQNIGKRYARMDEAGTPYCFTIDSDTLKDQTVTVRHRDTLQQERIGLDKVAAFLAEKIGG